MNRPEIPFTAVLLSIVSTVPAGAAVPNDAASLVRHSGIRGGFVIHLGGDDGTVTAQLAAGPQYVVQGLDADRGRWPERGDESPHSTNPAS